jgi:voltage-gated potassium channel
MSKRNSLQKRLYQIIFEHDTWEGRAFDVILILLILASVAAVMADSMADISARFGYHLFVLEWLFTILFTIEYILRLYCSPNAGYYARSFYGLIDLMAILPTYVSLFFPESRFLIVIRVLRVLRIFRILKLMEYVEEIEVLRSAIQSSWRRILVFLTIVLTVVLIVGSLMYLIEGPQAGYTSIPRSVYWAIVTVTTVGYGDITPLTPLGQALAAFLMILGYGLIAVPSGIVTIELGIEKQRRRRLNRVCTNCNQRGHDQDARFCKLCGAELESA